MLHWNVICFRFHTPSAFIGFPLSGCIGTTLLFPLIWYVLGFGYCKEYFVIRNMSSAPMPFPLNIRAPCADLHVNDILVLIHPLLLLIFDWKKVSYTTP